MTYGLDLFSDVPPANTPMTVFTVQSMMVLSACCLIQSHNLRRVVGFFFTVLLFLSATTASANYQITGPVTYSANVPESYRAPIQESMAGVIGLVADTPVNLAAAMFAAAPQYGPGPAFSAYVKYSHAATTGDRVRVVYRHPTAGYDYEVYVAYGAAPTCEAGVTAPLNLGVGYAKTIANTDDWIDPQFHTSACKDSCQVSVGLVVPGSCYVTGLVGPPYPGYCNFETTTTGNACTAADEAATQTLPPIPCPQGMASGSVNGARGCYKVSDVTKETTTTSNPDGSTTTTETTTGPNGTTTTTTTCSGTGNCTTTIQHVGGGAGTGAPSETGQNYDGKPEGSPEGEEEGEGACGKEGLPDCKVKVNEEGTPETVEGAQEALSGVIDGVQERLEYLGGMGWVREDLPFVWGPDFPSGSCSAIEIYGQPINICDPLAKVRLVWAFIISFMAGLYIWRSGTQAVKG